MGFIEPGNVREEVNQPTTHDGRCGYFVEWHCHPKCSQQSKENAANPSRSQLEWSGKTVELTADHEETAFQSTLSEWEARSKKEQHMLSPRRYFFHAGYAAALNAYPHLERLVQTLKTNTIKLHGAARSHNKWLRFSECAHKDCVAARAALAPFSPAVTEFPLEHEALNSKGESL